MKSKVLLSGAVALAMATAVMGPVATKSVNVYAAETTQNQQATQNQETTKNVEASKNVLTGKCGDNATYTYDKDAKTIVVSGTGAMWDDMEILGNYDSVKSITIEDGIYKDWKRCPNNKKKSIRICLGRRNNNNTCKCKDYRAKCICNY